MGRDAMTVLGLRQAAQQAAVSKSTILRAIRAGRLSALRTDGGGYAIDPAELFRVYPACAATQRSAVQGQQRGLSTDATAGAEAISHVAVQEAELAGARQVIALLHAQIDDLRSDRDGWRQQAESTQRLLAYAQEKPLSGGEGHHADMRAAERMDHVNAGESSLHGNPGLRAADEQTPEMAMAQIRAGLLSLVDERAANEQKRSPWWKRLAASFA